MVDDQIGSHLDRGSLPCHPQPLARGCRGTYHAANTGFCSWNEFARALLPRQGLGVRVEPMTTGQLNRPARAAAPIPRWIAPNWSGTPVSVSSPGVMR